MDELFTLHPNGLFLRGEALDAGYRDRDLSNERRAGHILRIRHGAYAPRTIWDEADPVGRHALEAQAVTLRHPFRVALSHTSGAVVHGLRLWDPALAEVHATRLAGSTSRNDAGVVYHRDRWDPSHIYQKDEMLLLDPTRCALGAAALTSVEAGIVVLDSLMDLDLGDEKTLAATYATMSRSPFTRHLQLATRLARRGSQSVAESRVRYLFYVHHVPEPQLQYEVYDGARLVGICDFAWPEYGLLGEMDGKIKYGRLLKPGERPGDAVYREKKREDELREVTGFGMIRYTYGDLFIPAQTAARTERMLSRRRSA